MIKKNNSLQKSVSPSYLIKYKYTYKYFYSDLLLVYFNGNFFDLDYNKFLYSYFDCLIFSILTIIPLLLIVAFFTLVERKLMASVQRRKGPSVVGYLGILQPFADGLKLIFKEIIVPNKANKFLFLFSPFFTLFLSFLNWCVINFDLYTLILNFNNSLLYVFVISALNVYGIFLSGWSSNSKYALMGSIRSVSQMISYEISISLILIPIVLFSGSLNLNKIVFMQVKTVWFIFPLLPLSIIFFISILAETNRAPFDLPEAEAELVAGYNVEYSGIMFAFFFLGEYANIFLMSSLFVIFFLGGGSSVFGFSLLNNSFLNIFIFDLCFGLKTIFIVFWFIFVRANLPRFRFDQLMFIGWKIILPLSLSLLLFYASILISFNSLPLHQLPRINSSCMFIDINLVRI